MNREDLINKFEYNSNTGIFKRRSTGRICGTDNGGYLEIVIYGDRYYCHRLAWLYTHGYFPENYIDHINRDKKDNRITNIRETVNQCNIRNSGNFSHNTSGIKGVTFSKKSEKWQTGITINKKLFYLGQYTDFDEAVCARLAAEQCIVWNNCDSCSPAYNYIKGGLNESNS